MYMIRRFTNNINIQFSTCHTYACMYISNKKYTHYGPKDINYTSLYNKNGKYKKGTLGDIIFRYTNNRWVEYDRAKYGIFKIKIGNVKITVNNNDVCIQYYDDVIFVSEDKVVMF